MPAAEYRLVGFAGGSAVSSNDPARIAILLDPASRTRGAGVEAVEGLLSTWLKTPIAIGHRDDGSPFIIGRDGLHISLGHATGATAVAIAEYPVGIDICEVGANPADRKVAAKLFSAHERDWLGRQAPAAQATAFAQVWALKEAALKCRKEGLDRHELPDTGALLAHLSAPTGVQTAEWRPWMPLSPTAASRPLPAGLKLALPMAQMSRIADRPASLAVLTIPSGAMAIALAWAQPPV